MDTFINILIGVGVLVGIYHFLKTKGIIKQSDSSLDKNNSPDDHNCYDYVDDNDCIDPCADPTNPLVIAGVIDFCGFYHHND